MFFPMFLAKLWSMSLTAGVTIVFVLLLRFLLKKAPKVISYALWGIVLFRLLCPVSIESRISFFGLLDTPTQESLTLSDSIAFVPGDPVEVQYPTAAHPVTDAEGIRDEPMPQNRQPLTADIVSVAGWVWMAGVLVMAIYAAASYLRLRRKLFTAIHLQGNIWTADGIPSPFVMGLFCPKIYLPSAMEQREQSYIILHEQYHIRRFDHVIKAVSFAALCLHWFNPLVWVAFIIAGRDMEMSCDEAVVKKMGEDVLADYTASLLSLATGKQIIAGMPLAFGEGDTKGRIQNLASWKRPVLWVVVTAVIVCAVFAVCLVTDPLTKNGPQPIREGKYQVAELIYDSTAVSLAVTPEMMPSYRISEDMLLSSCQASGKDGQWTSLGTLTETELDRENFDARFQGTEYEWMRKESPSSIRKNNVKAWLLLCHDALSGRDTLYYLLQQENGELLLAWGIYDSLEKGDPYSDDTVILQIVRLAREVTSTDASLYIPGISVTELVPGTTYVSYQCLYMNPLSSFAAIGGDSGCRYTVYKDHFEMVNRTYGTQNVVEVTDWQWKPFPYTKEEWAALYKPTGWNVMDVHTLFQKLEYLPLNAGRFLMRADGDIWLVELSGSQQTGVHLWSIYRLVPESAMGTAQWTFAPLSSFQSPVFSFEFNLDYEKIFASCDSGQLVEFNYGDGKGRELTVPAGKALHWSPTGDGTVMNPNTKICFTVYSTDGTRFSGTLYIEATEDTERGRVYTAYLTGTGLQLFQDAYRSGGVISLGSP